MAKKSLFQLSIRRDIIKTDENYKEANINWESTELHIKNKLLSDGVVITQGFIGSTFQNSTTTLGREGSDFTAAILAYVLEVNELIVRCMDSQVSLIPQLAGHIVAAGGKRIRPMMTLASARLCGYIGKRHISLAACVEFIHTATLLHDDVVDESDLRRGLASANVVWGNQASVLVGDFLFSRAFELMVDE